MSGQTVANLMRGHIEALAARGERTDGRGANEFRDVSIETGLIGTAEGSSRVSLGDTTVMCGVKLLVGTPYPDSPGRGSMTTTAELACLASEQFEPGPPREPAIELARVVDRGEHALRPRALRDLLPPREELPAPETISQPGDLPPSDALDDWRLLPTNPNWATGFAEYWSVGEDAAHERLDWWADHVGEYDDGRNLPSVDQTSQMSPHLHWGEISPVQIWHRLKDKRSDGWRTYESELIWRDYAQNVLCQFPRYPEESYRDAIDDAKLWRNPNRGHVIQEELEAWQQGRTGYPIVDAGMRQLWAIGWMHNRVRMIAASFLIKHLLIDWRHGERWFWDTLVDADYASNGTNWQWVAGTGVDSNMFPRIMAPLSQSEKFDAAGYVREWVPELADLPDSEIHDPSDKCRPSSYPEKIIGHREARERALAAYREMKGN